MSQKKPFRYASSYETPGSGRRQLAVNPFELDERRTAPGRLRRLKEAARRPLIGPEGGHGALPASPAKPAWPTWPAWLGRPFPSSPICDNLSFAAAARLAHGISPKSLRAGGAAPPRDGDGGQNGEAGALGDLDTFWPMRGRNGKIHEFGLQDSGHPQNAP